MKKETKAKNDIVIYKAPDGSVQVDVTLKRETVWLSLDQIAMLFQRHKSVISRHLRNVFLSKELEKVSVVANFATTAADGKTYQVDYYNLDAILSVGYRVNSKRGTQFRQWASTVLRNYIVQGYALNTKRLEAEASKYRDLQKSITLMKNILNRNILPDSQARSLLEVISDYAYALDILDGYDHKNLKTRNVVKKERFQLTEDDAKKVIIGLEKKFGGSSLFGKEKDKSFAGSLNAIYQSFGGQDVYSSVEEKAANLLYFVIKNHSFVDGNKRIAAALFIYFLDRNGILYRSDGSKRLADNALVALTLMIAESRADEKEIIIKVVINLINQNN